MMNREHRAAELAAHNLRRRVTRDDDGGIVLSWGAVSIKISQEEFLDLAGLVADAVSSPARYGELARGRSGRVARCSMGQILLSYGSLTLWFSPEEFEELHRLVYRARQRLADTEPLPRFGVPWIPQRNHFSAN